MKLLIPVFALCLSASASIHYVDSVNGLDANNGTSPATPWKTVNKVNGTSFVAGDTINWLCNDTFSDATLNLNFTTSGTAWTAGNFITLDMYGSGCQVPPYIVTMNTGKNYIVFRHLNFQAVTLTGDHILIDQCVIKGNPTFAGLYVNTATAVDMNAYSSIITEALNDGVHTYGHLVLRNDEIIANGYGASSSSYAMWVSGSAPAAIDYGHTLFAGNGTDPTQFRAPAGSSTYTDSGGNIWEQPPGWLGWPGGNAYFHINMQADAYNGTAQGNQPNCMAAYATLMTPSQGQFFDLMPSNIDGTNGAQQAALATYVSNGWALGQETRSHTLFNSAFAFQLSTTNAAATFSNDGTTVTLSTTTPGNSVTYAASGTYSGFVSAIAGKSWTIGTASINSNARMSEIATYASQSITGTATNIDFDRTAGATNRWYVGEIGTYQTQIKGYVNAGDQAKTAVYCSVPNTIYSGTNPDVISWIQANTSCIGGWSFNSGANAGFLSSVSIYRWYAPNFGGIRTTQMPDPSVAPSVTAYTNCVTTACPNCSQAQFAYMARHQWVRAMTFNMISDVYFHFEPWPQELNYYTGEIQRLGGTMSSGYQIATAIRADHTTSDSLTYTKTYADGSNFKPGKKWSGDTVWGHPVTWNTGIDTTTLTPASDGTCIDARDPNNLIISKRSSFGQDIGPWCGIKRKEVGM